jgi:peptide/nickel transport system substrate-binding protein
LLAAVAGAMCLTLASCGSSANSSGASSSSAGDTQSSSAEVNRDATLRVGVDAVPTTFDPIQNAGTQGNYTLPQLYDQLVQLDADFQPEAMLATSWEFNADGTELTMKLRDDAVFNGDGSPVNAVAVKASIERAKADPKSLVGAQLANVSAVDAIDATTVKFTFAQPAYSFVADLAADPRISSVVDPAHMDTDALARTPAGSGPYTLGDATQSKVVLNRTAKHWDETSGLAKTIELNAIADENSRFNAVKAGQLDVTYVTTGQFKDATEIVEGGGFQTVYEPKIQKYNLGVNGTETSPLANPDVRLAISKAIDRTQFCNTAFPGLSTPTRQLVSPVNPVYDASLDDEASLTAQPDEAKALLAKAGVQNPTISIVTFGTLTTQSEILKQQLADVGITLDVNVQGALPAVLEVWNGGGANSRFLSQSGAPDPTAIVRQSIENSKVSGGVPDYLQAALDKAKTTAPGAERDAAGAEVNKILTEQPVNIPLCDIGLGLLASDKVTGLEDVRFLGFAPPYETRRVGLTG